MTDDHQKRQILMANLERAIEIAVLAHKGASDKSGAPYILHPLRLMFGIEDIEAKIVAVLHDVLPNVPTNLTRRSSNGFFRTRSQTE
jgi:(p)ppGpp synthase/HD superfamily hydrolase